MKRPSRRAAAAAAVLALGATSCGGVGEGSSTAAPAAAPQEAKARLAVDEGPEDVSAANAPQVRRDPVVGGVASFSVGSKGQRSDLARLYGLGFAGGARRNGTSYVGPGVTLPWTEINHGTYTVAVRHRGKRLGLRVWSRGGVWRARVGGRLVSTKPRKAGSDYAFHTLWLRFPSTRTRTVEVDLRHGAWLAGLRAGRGESVSLPPRRSRRSIYWLGDSYFDGTGAKHPGFTDLVHVASSRLRLGEATVDALGGTGFVKTNTGAKFPDYLTRVRRNIRAGRSQPSVMVIAGSINDGLVKPRELERRAERVYRTIAEASPSTKVLVAPFTVGYPPSPGNEARTRALQRSAEGAPNVIGVLDLPRLAQEQTGGRGLQAAAHPTQAGHRLYGRLIADYLRQRVPSLR